MERVKLNYEFGTVMDADTVYTYGTGTYLNKSVIPWPEGLEIFVSNTGESGTWSMVYGAKSLKGKIRTEKRPETLIDARGGKRTYYVFPFDEPVTAKYLRIGIKGIKPWLGAINIPEIEILGSAENLETQNFRKITMNVPDTAKAKISGGGIAGAEYALSGSEVKIEVTPKDEYRVKSVKLNGNPLRRNGTQYGFTMPDEAVTVDVECELKPEENTNLKLVSSSVDGGNAVSRETVPVITFDFNLKIGDVSRNMITVNGKSDSGLVQHAFKDVLNPTKLHVVLFGDKLEPNTAYRVAVKDTLKSSGGMPLSGEAAEYITTSADYSGVAENNPGYTWNKNISAVSIDRYNSNGSEWQQIPAVTQELRDMGESGGEGGQWMQAIEADNVDGQLLFGGVDIGGIVRSTDGGKSWHRSASGFMAVGCVDIKIDPNNKNRVLAIGSCSNSAVCGIYLSEDMGTTWKQVHSYIFNGQRDTRKQIAWDKSSYSEALGGSRIAYWSNMYNLVAPNESFDQTWVKPKSDRVGGLYKTTNGGKSWFLVNSEMSDSVVEVNPLDGTVYVGNKDGFFRSTDGGVTFDRIISGEPIMGLDVIETRPNNVYINNNSGVLVSEDGGRTFEAVPAIGFPSRHGYELEDVRNITRDLAISPANPDYMLVDSRDYIHYNNHRYFSHDGGRTWTECVDDKSKDFFFNHNRQHPFAWHPTDENKVWSLGGDWITSSSDGGETFIWDANGYCGTPPGGRFNFNPYNTDLIFAGAQDLLGILSTNGGYTWKPIKPENGGGFGCAYGSVALDENTLVAAIADGWYEGRTLRVSTDGGETFGGPGLELKLGYARRATSFWLSPSDPDTVIAGEYISHDRAQTWNEMTGCNFVLAVNYYHNKELWGLYKENHEEYIVCSYDNGETWYPFAKSILDDARIKYDEATNYMYAEGMHVWDLEYDGINDILYYIPGHRNTGMTIIKIKDNEQINIGNNANMSEKTGARFFHTMAIDPRHPEILYTGCYDTIRQDTAVQRSCDGGETFQTLTAEGASTSVVKTGPSAGSGVETLVVHPETGDLWMWASAEGIWKFPAPYKNSK